MTVLESELGHHVLQKEHELKPVRLGFKSWALSYTSFVP